MESNRVTFFVLALALALLVGDRLLAPRPALAQEVGSGGVFALTAPGPAPGNNVLYVIDSHSLRLLVYEHRVGGPLRLLAVRNMEYDLRYQEWPNPNKVRPPVQIPSVAQMRPH